MIPRARAGSRFAAALLLWAAAVLSMPDARGQDAAAMRARQSALRDRLADNPFRRPLVLDSTHTGDTLKGDIYAVVPHPFGVVGQALQKKGQWCDILIVQPNVKECFARGSGVDAILDVTVGRKFHQALADAYPFAFAYRVTASGPNYLGVRLDADAGPLGTTNYRIALEAVPLDATGSFVHLSYSYSYGAVARVLMEGYLATLGRTKVGFSIVERGTDGKPVYQGGVRGAIERNTMRYYLALEAYLGAYALPAAEQPERRLRDWFTAVEHYPLQLHEMERGEYLSMKRRELARHEAASVAAR